MADKYTPRQKTAYDERIAKAMTEKFGYANPLEVPKLEKITPWRLRVTSPLASTARHSPRASRASSSSTESVAIAGAGAAPRAPGVPGVPGPASSDEPLEQPAVPRRPER